MYKNIYKTQSCFLLTLAICAAMSFSAKATIYPFTRTYSGANEVPPNPSTATGTITGTYNDVTRVISYTIVFSGLSANATAGHFHAPAAPGANAGVMIGYVGFPLATSGIYINSHILTPLQEAHLMAGLVYSNIHTSLYPGGELRTQIILGAPYVEPTISCPANITVSNAIDQCAQSVSFLATATGNPAPTITYTIGATTITSPHNFPVGTTTVTATATNLLGSASCSFTVTVNDTQGPSISNLSTNPGSLWPVNHKMKDVAVAYTTTDNCPGPVTCQLSVSSNEAVNGSGDGNTSPDWTVVGAHLVKLRAERSGGGDGRIYTITVTCRDQYGNTSQSNTAVVVPHDRSSITRAGIEAELLGESGMHVKVLSNPSRSRFTLAVQSNNTQEEMSIRIFDISGRLLEMKTDLKAGDVVSVGNNLKAGFYFLELKQGTQNARIKLVKQE